MQLFPTNQKKSRPQSLLSVYLQVLLYYDNILSYFALIFQYFQFVYKYNILFYTSSTIAGELILLTILLIANGTRIRLGTSGNKGKKYLRLFGFLVLDLLLVVGYVYVIAIQSNALFLEEIIAIIGLVFAGSTWLLGLVVMIYFRAME